MSEREAIQYLYSFIGVEQTGSGEDWSRNFHSLGAAQPREFAILGKRVVPMG